MITAEEIARQMALNAQYSEVQLIQTRFRMELVESWQIAQGSRVLEIGCGQGDMTAVLAHAVGRSGHVTAVDIANPEYGAPVSVGASAKHLLKTPLGQRIDFHFNYDLLDPSNVFPPDTFDYVVLAHCSWYFASIDQLRRILLRVKPWTRRLCYSEWDMQPQALDQIGHMLAVLIQGQVEAFKAESDANIRSAFSRTRLKALLQETGWIVSTESMIDTAQLQDAGWEIDWCLKSSVGEAQALNVPLRFRELLSSQIDVLRLAAQQGNNRPLPSYSMVAERLPETDIEQS